MTPSIIKQSPNKPPTIFSSFSFEYDRAYKLDGHFDVLHDPCRGFPPRTPGVEARKSLKNRENHQKCTVYGCHGNENNFFLLKIIGID